MARDSVFNAASVLRKVCGLDISEYDLPINVIGGANIEGPRRRGFFWLYAVPKQCLSARISLSAQLSLQGKIKPGRGWRKTLRCQDSRCSRVLPQENFL